MNEDPPEIIANVPVYYAPAESFAVVSGVTNYTRLTPDPTFGPIRPDSGPAIYSVDSPTPEPTRSFPRPYSRTSFDSTVETMASPAPESLDVLVFMGSVRPGRNCDRVTKFIQSILQARNHRVTVIDPKEHNMATLEIPIHFYPDPTKIPAHLAALMSRIQKADAFVVIAAEYNSSISPALCSLMDHFPPLSYSHRPSAIVVYSMGQFGGIRASCQLRQYMSELQTVHIPSMVVVPAVHQTLNEAGAPATPDSPIVKAADTMVRELEWYAAALKKHRQNIPPPSPTAKRAS